ncbi:hypothetical protein PCK1_002208 [Pneumocystis canis]|nr:hypothetical protein PCK1_002208 [Pneumocystis canis]
MDVIKICVTFLISIITFIIIAIYCLQSRLIYLSWVPANSRIHVEKPDIYQIPYEDVVLSTPDGISLHAYLSIYNNSRPTFIYFHANAGNMGHRLPIVKHLYYDLKCNVLIFSYRGYGHSTGTPSENGIMIDSFTVLNYVHKHPILSKTPIIAYGQSLGGAVAIQSVFANQDKYSALIVENTFLSIPKLILDTMPYMFLIIGLCHQRWSSEDYISFIKNIPILFLSGQKDEVIPFYHMHTLYHLSSTKKVFKIFKEGTHNDTIIQPGYFETIAQFLQEIEKSNSQNNQYDDGRGGDGRGGDGDGGDGGCQGNSGIKEEKHLVGMASFSSSVSNLLNTAIGAGMLAMPYSMALTGLVPGIFLILFSGATCFLGLYFLVRCAAKLERGTASFNTLSSLSMPWVAILLDLTIGINCFGASVSYLILIGDVMPQVVLMFKKTISETSYLISRYFWITIFIFVVAPFTFFRRLDSLRYVSIVSLISIGYMVLIIIIYVFRRNIWNTDAKIDLFEGKGVSGFFSSISVFAFSYSCHQNMLPIVNEIRDNSHRNILNVIITSMVISTLIYLAVAILGYLSFGTNVPGNIVLAYEYSVATTIARIAIVILIAFSYPLQFFPSRISFDKVLSWCFKSFKFFNSSRDISSSNLRFNILTCLILLFSYVLAMTAHSFHRVLAYVGSIGSTAISFIFPGLFYIILAYSPDILYNKNNQNDCENLDNQNLVNRRKYTRAWYLKIIAYVLVIYGILVMIISLASNIFHS